MTRRLGRAPKGRRVHDAVPRNWGNNSTILGALSCHGPEAVMTGAGATEATVLRTFVEEVLAPRVRPDDSVVIDNLGAHKVDGIATAIHARGVRLMYWPPYSPDGSPIEPGWSKLKTCLRACEELHQALARAIDRATPADAGGWLALAAMPYINRQTALVGDNAARGPDPAAPEDRVRSGCAIEASPRQR